MTVLHSLTPPTVLPLLGVCMDKHMLVSPLMSRDLFNALHNETKAGFCGVARLCILREVALGLEYIHSQRVEHRDLKSSNVLLDAGNHAKLIDFGLARLQAATVASTKDDGAGGTPAWMAPERLKKKRDRVTKKPLTIDWQKADVFSLAMVWVEVLTETLPYAEFEPSDFGDYTDVVVGDKERPSLGDADLAPSITRGVSKAHVDEVVAVVKRGWAHEPKDRARVGEFAAVVAARAPPTVPPPTTL